MHERNTWNLLSESKLVPWYSIFLESYSIFTRISSKKNCYEAKIVPVCIKLKTSSNKETSSINLNKSQVRAIARKLSFINLNLAMQEKGGHALSSYANLLLLSDTSQWSILSEIKIPCKEIWSMW